MPNRRLLLGGAGALAALAAFRWLQGSDVEAAGAFELEKTDSEWRTILTKAQYEVLRLHRTETPGSSPLNHEKRDGTYACAACDLPLAKFHQRSPRLRPMGGVVSFSPEIQFPFD